MMKIQREKTGCLLLALLLFVTAVFPMGWTVHAAEKKTEVALKSTTYAGVWQNVTATTTEGTLGADDPFSWSLYLVDPNSGSMTDVTKECDLLPGAKGILTDNTGRIYQNASFLIPLDLDYTGKQLQIQVTCKEDGSTAADTVDKVYKPITQMTLEETDECANSYFNSDTNTLYCDQSETEDEYFADLLIHTDSTEDGLVAVPVNGINYNLSPTEDPSTFQLHISIDAKKAANSGLYISLDGKSGYKFSKTINLIKGIPMKSFDLKAMGGIFADNLRVASTSNDFHSGYKAQTGEKVYISASLSPSSTNDTLKYDLYDDTLKYIRTFDTDSSNGCTIQINEAGSYHVYVQSTSMLNGTFPRSLSSYFNVLVKDRNPITSFTSSTPNITLCTKEYNEYKTSGSLKDYITASPTEYLDIIDYSSDNPSLVSIDPQSGDFKLGSKPVAGKTKLWVKSRISGISKSIDLEVKAATQSMSIQAPAYTILPGGHSEQLALTVVPADSFEGVTWTSTKPEILSVDEHGRITADANYHGDDVNVNIIATSDSGVTAQTSITVTEAIPATAASISLTADASKYYDKGDQVYDVYYGTSISLECDMIAANSQKSNDIIFWVVSSGDNQGDISDYFKITEQTGAKLVLTSKTEQPVTLTAYAMKAGQSIDQADASASITIRTIVPAKSVRLSTSTDKVMISGNTFDLTASMTGNPSSMTATDHLVFVSSNSAVASVEQNGSTATIKAYNSGNAIITCYACYDPEQPTETASASASLNIMVYDKYELNPEELTIADIPDKIYTGSAICPSLSISYKGKRLTQEKDYTVVYANNTKVGTARITIYGAGDYTGKLEKTFQIVGYSITKATVASLENKIYNGTAWKPEMNLRIGDAKLVEGTDYQVSYQDNVNAGTAVVTIVGMGNYTGQLTKKFTIQRQALSEATLLSMDNQIYTGTAITPKPVIKFEGMRLTEGKDFKLSYSNNTNVGTARITISGIQNFSGSLTQEFTIEQASDIRVKLSKSQFSYNGSVQKPVVTVKNENGIALKENTDYTIAYSGAESKDIGYYALTITCKGNYIGIKKLNYTIGPKGSNRFTKVTSKAGKIKVRFSRNKNAAGYLVQYADNRSFQNARSIRIKRSRLCTASTKKLTKGKKYYFRVCSYQKSGGALCYGTWSKTKAVKCR